MRLCYIFLSLYFVSCTSTSKTDPQKVSIQNFFEVWDSSTIVSLKNYAINYPRYAGKADFIINSIESKAQGVNILDRSKFIQDFNKEKIALENNKNSRIVIVELNQSGEKNSYKKYLINDIDSCYVFTKDNLGNWGVTNKFKINIDYVSYIATIHTDTTQNNSWGNSVNDICIISILNKDSIAISPVISLSLNGFEKMSKNLNNSQVGTGLKSE